MAPIHLKHPPNSWRTLQSIEMPKGNVAACAWGHSLIPGLKVLRSISRMENNAGSWIHVSVSLPTRLPSWIEIKKVHADFIGDNIAIQVMPKHKDYVNVHPYCLHLWSPLSGTTALPNLQDIEWEHGA